MKRAIKMKNNHKFILSLDIGGANTKFSLLHFNIENYIANKEIQHPDRYKTILRHTDNLLCEILYFPFWQREKDDFSNTLQSIKTKTEIAIKKYQKNNSNIDYSIVVTVTAELSDAFYTKEEGIRIIASNLKEVFPDKQNEIKFINAHAKFVSLFQAIDDYLSVSASNWVATSLVFGEREKLGMLLDMGSTTLDLIPIKDGVPQTIGKNDVDRLLNEELFYTGVLRPPVATIVQSVPFRNAKCPISFERFALMADVYLILGKITEDQYTCDTADGRGKDLESCYARLARMVCGDINLVKKSELEEIANYIYNAQRTIVEEVIRQSINIFVRRFVTPISKIRFNITGLGAKILLKPALNSIDIKDKQIFFRGLSEEEHVISTAICLGIVFLKNIIRKHVFEQNKQKNLRSGENHS